MRTIQEALLWTLVILIECDEGLALRLIRMDGINATNQLRTLAHREHEPVPALMRQLGCNMMEIEARGIMSKSIRILCDRMMQCL